LTLALESVLVAPLTTNLDRAKLAGNALIGSSSLDGPPQDSVALAFQMRAIPKSALKAKIRDLDESELEELELATDEALGRVEPN
jgi:mRNA-degrading endonuclease toxin of MazEF toxin-antitoxin module